MVVTRNGFIREVNTGMTTTSLIATMCVYRGTATLITTVENYAIVIMSMAITRAIMAIIAMSLMVLPPEITTAEASMFMCPEELPMDIIITNSVRVFHT